LKRRDFKRRDVLLPNWKDSSLFRELFGGDVAAIGSGGK